MLKAPAAELCQNACRVVNQQKIICFHQCSTEFSMNKFRAYIHIHMFRPSQDSSVWLGLASREVENNWCHQSAIYIYIYRLIRWKKQSYFKKPIIFRQVVFLKSFLFYQSFTFFSHMKPRIWNEYIIQHIWISHSFTSQEFPLLQVS